MAGDVRIGELLEALDVGDPVDPATFGRALAAALGSGDAGDRAALAALASAVTDRSGSVLAAVAAGALAPAPAPAVKSLRGRIVDALGGGPSCPSELAARLGSDKFQVSRALRQLTAAGAVVLVPSSVVGDRRTRWYQLAPAAGA